MSIIFDKNPKETENTENKVNTRHEKSQFLAIKSLRNMNIKPDSPRTLQACLELGLDQKLMEIKSYESFASPELTKDLVQLRYEHYLGRLNLSWIEIQQRRRDIMQRNRLALQYQSSSEARFNNSSVSPLNIDVNQAEFKDKVNKIHSKTLAYLQGSHDHPNITQPDEVISSDQNFNSLKPFEREMEKDLKRYNRMKIQKIREASIKLEDENKKLQIMDNLDRKHKQVYLVAMKQQNEQNVQKIKQKRLSKSKDQRLIEAEELNWLVKKNEKEQTLQKIQKLNEKQRQQQQNKLRSENEEYQKEILRRQNREITQSENQKLQREQEQTALQKIQDKFEASEKQHVSMMHSQITRMKDQIQRDQSQFLKLKSLKEVQDQQNLSLLINKMVQKEQSLRNNLEMEILEDKKKRTLKLVKEKKTEVQKIILKTSQKQKINDLDEKFVKIDENNMTRKMQQEDMMMHRQELRRLRDSDKQENYERCQRLNDYNLQKTIQKNKKAQSRLEQSKIQKSVLQQTSLEISREGTFERQRIYSGLQKVTDSLYHQKICDIHNKPQSEQEKARSLKILKSLFGEQQSFMNKDSTKKDILTLLRPQPESEKGSPSSNVKVRKIIA